MLQTLVEVVMMAILTPFIVIGAAMVSVVGLVDEVVDYFRAR